MSARSKGNHFFHLHSQDNSLVFVCTRVTPGSLGPPWGPSPSGVCFPVWGSQTQSLLLVSFVHWTMARNLDCPFENEIEIHFHNAPATRQASGCEPVSSQKHSENGFQVRSQMAIRCCEPMFITEMLSKESIELEKLTLESKRSGGSPPPECRNNSNGSNEF